MDSFFKSARTITRNVTNTNLFKGLHNPGTTYAQVTVILSNQQSSGITHSIRINSGEIAPVMVSSVLCGITLIGFQ